MATRLYSIGQGESDDAVVEAVGSAVVTKSIELTVDLAANNTKMDVLKALISLSAYIIRNKWPPA